MENVEEQRKMKFLAKASKNPENNSGQANIFASLRTTQPLPRSNKIKGKVYDVVGSAQFRQNILQPNEDLKVTNNQSKEVFNQTGNVSMNTTLHRNTMISKMRRQQNNAFCKDRNYLTRYRDYQNKWEADSHRFHSKSHRSQKQKTLLERNVKEMYVHPNHDKIAVLNDFVVHYWEMSLRNNHHILERHIKGHKFNRVELEELLQLEKGRQMVEKSIPVLPMDKLKKVGKRDLSLAGRNKRMSETGLMTTRMNGSINQQEVLKVDYDSNLKWMSTEGLM